MKQKIDEIRYKLVSINKDINEIQRNQQICKNTYNINTNPSTDIQNTKQNNTNKNTIPNPNKLKFTKYAKINPQLFSSYNFRPVETPHFKTITDLDLFFNSENKLSTTLTKRDSIKNSNLMTESISNITQLNSSQKIKNNQNKLYIPEKINTNSEFLKIIIEKNKSKKRRIKNLCSKKLKMNSTIEQMESFINSKRGVSGSISNRLDFNILGKKLIKNKSIFHKLKTNKNIYSSENSLDNENNDKKILTEINNNTDNKIVIGTNKEDIIKNTNQKFIIQKNALHRHKTNIFALNTISSRNTKNNKKEMIRDNKSIENKDIKKKNMSISYNNLINNNNTCNLVIKTRPKIKYVNYGKSQKNHEYLIHELIKISNDYYNNEIMNENNIIDKYKAILNENMIYKNFIQKLFKLQTNSNGASQMKNQKIEENNEKSSINMLYNWIKRMSVNEKNSEENIDN